MTDELELLSKIERKPENLICGLQKLQAAFGAVTDAGIRAAAHHFGRSESDVAGVVAFYPQFIRSTTAKRVIEVCRGRACGRKNSVPLQKELEKYADRFTVKTVDCLGVCAQAPAVRIDGKLHTRVDRKKLAELLAFKEKTE